MITWNYNFMDYDFKLLESKKPGTNKGTSLSWIISIRNIWKNWIVRKLFVLRIVTWRYNQLQRLPSPLGL